MSEETVGVIIAALVLAVFLYFARSNRNAQTTVGTTPPVGNVLADAASPSDFVTGPSYFIANQPYYFAPPVGNMMPQATQSNTVATNEEGASCGCG